MRVVKARHAAYYTTIYIPFSLALVGVPPALIGSTVHLAADQQTTDGTGFHCYCHQTDSSAMM
jgi:hypothetical protein